MQFKTHFYIYYEFLLAYTLLNQAKLSIIKGVVILSSVLVYIWKALRNPYHSENEIVCISTTEKFISP